MVVKVLLLLVSLFHIANSARVGSWEFIGQGCVGAKNNKFKAITYVGPSSLIRGMKLVHRSGYVGCSASARSNWGCAAGRKELGMIITDEKDKILYPSPRLVNINSGGWYTLPSYTSSSSELVFTDFGYPKYFKKEGKLRIWYGEDLKGYTEADNHGSTCMDIYVYSMAI